MKTKLIGLTTLTLFALATGSFAAGHGGGGGFGGGGFSGGGAGRGGGFGGGRAAAARSGALGFSSGRPAYFYSRGMGFAGRRSGLGFAGSRTGQMRSAFPQSHSPTTNSATHSAQRTERAPLNGRTDHISERHNAANWHNDWDRRHSHFFNHRFFVFDDGFWFGLDPGFFPWDYYPYYAYDYYPYDYYPGYYADVEPYYYNEGVYSDMPVQDPTVSTVQTELTQQGYYNGPVDGIYGPSTRDAVANYQIAKGLNVTGSLSPDTLQSLNISRPTAS